jgi:arabinose-5-phosphate isomerase
MSLATAKKVLESEIKSLRQMSGRLKKNFNRVVSLIRRAKGRVIVMGMGKPGFVGQKISASLASTGTPSLFLHPAEALHGDIGRVVKEDVVITLSNSGETEEIIRLIPILKQIGCKCIAMTGNIDSSLAKSSNLTLDTSVESEAGPLTMVPTASVLCMLAMGDALTMALVHHNKFRPKDFAFFHQGGSLGKRLYTKVSSVMRKGARNPLVKPEAKIDDVLFKITRARAGAVTVVDRRGKCCGIFTDGDLRRHLKKISLDMSQPVHRFMTANPIVVQETMLAADAALLLQKKQIDELPVVNEKGFPVGMLDIQDLLGQGFTA